MEEFRVNRSTGAPDKVERQKILSNGENVTPKLWPTQRSTVARLGLLRQSRSVSRTSTSCFESSDTLGSNSSSKTSLLSEISSSLPSSRSHHLPPVQKRGFPTPRKFEKITEPMSPLIQFDRKEVLQALKSISHPIPNLKQAEDSILLRDGKEKYDDEKYQSRIQNPSEENERSWKESQLKLSGHESWVTCADFSNSMILKMKNPKEREEFTDLCFQALSVKMETYDQLMRKNSETYQQQMEKIHNVNRDEYKSHLCKAMLKLINNEKLRQEQNCRNFELQRKTRKRINYSKKGVEQVYVVGGRTILGDPLEKVNFPNSFSSPSELIDPKDDPPGYHRFKVEVDMRNLPGDQFSIQLYNEKTLMFTVDDESTETVKVELPRGIFADKLRIARKGNGPLIIQEPWIF